MFLSLIPNQAGVSIDILCNSATDAGNIVGNGECYFDDGTDLIVWTKHFTNYAAYTSTSNPPSGGGGTSSSSGAAGGGGSGYYWECGEWSACSPSGIQTRSCSQVQASSGSVTKPEETRSCEPEAPSGNRVSAEVPFGTEESTGNRQSGEEIVAQQPSGITGFVGKTVDIVTNKYMAIAVGFGVLLAGSAFYYRIYRKKK